MVALPSIYSHILFLTSNKGGNDWMEKQVRVLHHPLYPCYPITLGYGGSPVTLAYLSGEFGPLFTFSPSWLICLLHFHLLIYPYYYLTHSHGSVVKDRKKHGKIFVRLLRIGLNIEKYLH